MPLEANATLGSYKIESLIGKGGMGEVYRARDTALDRAVAIKVLPETLASNAERVARFEREARLLATLSHQNIAGIYGLEEANGTRYLVLELVEGRTLQDQLKAAAMPMEETLRICRQITEAVAAAHERGIIHRDLKPGNIMITGDDTIKVLDFGIAKALDSIGDDMAQAPTLSAAHRTAAGTMVGTPTYMSPEQARGKPIDRRTDIWSFGCVLFECLTAKTAFGGDTVTDTLAKILERDPDYTLVPAETPLAVQMVLRRCLQKDRKKRLQDIGDARVQIEEAMADPTGSTLGFSGSYTAIEAPRSKVRLAWLFAGLLAVVAAIACWSAWTIYAKRSSIAPGTRLALVLPDVETDWENLGYDLSPDGQTVVFRARPLSPMDGEKPPSQLFVRKLDEFESSPIPGTERGWDPAFSPSGEWIGFKSWERSTGRTLLKRVALDGSPAITIRDITKDNIDDFTWLTDDTLFLVLDKADPLANATLSVETGSLREITLKADDLGDFVDLGLSTVLPGGTSALGETFRVVGTQVRTDMFILSLEDWVCRKVLDNVQGAALAAGGRLVFLRDRTLFATPFDATSGTIIGRISPLISGVEHFKLCDTGVLLYHPIAGTTNERRLMTVDAQGNTEPLTPVKRPFQEDLTLSGDGRVLAVQVWDETTFPRIWLFELDTDLIRPLTPADEICFGPTLSHNGQRVAFMRWNSTKPAIMVAPTNGTSEAKAVLEFEQSTGWMYPGAWTKDDQALLITKYKRADNDFDILRLDVESGKTTPVLASAANEHEPALSPDGTIIAYQSNMSGNMHLYIRSFASETNTVGPSVRVSPEGRSSNLRWSSDGRRLYYLDQDDQLQRVRVSTDPQLGVSDPEPVLDARDFRIVEDKEFVPLPDGRFVFIQKGADEKTAEHLNIVLNWFDELDKKVPVR